MTSAQGRPRETVDLSGVSETALLTLHARACEARRATPILDDPMAIALHDSIDFDFAKFGRTRQDIALRARLFDTQARAYLTQHPSATVVALAEGLQTSFWRLDAAIPDGQFRWLTVDLPPIVDVRTRLLPASPRVSACAQSALDYSWVESVDASGGVFITAEGLLMYLQPEQALDLIAQCAKAFPGGRMLFDLPPSWFSKVGRHGLRTSLRYKGPPIPFSLSAGQAADLVNTVPGVRAVRDLQLPPGRGLVFNAALSLLYRTRALRALRPRLTLLE
ncbi:MAG: class I SAM-dependent methyltransferase, partial [Mycobacterium sp.]